MADVTPDASKPPIDDASDDPASLDEARLGRAFAIGLPIATVLLAFIVLVVFNLALAILVLAAGALLGTIALLWASLRVLSGDAALPPELEALDATAHGVDALASRKKMLLRALKDLDNERALGKLDESDHDEIAASYREELKDVLRKIEASLAPYRARAEDLALEHLTRVGLLEPGYRGAASPGAEEAAVGSADAPRLDEAAKDAPSPSPSGRVTCAQCGASNEPDARFCKGCGAPVAKVPAANAEDAEETEETEEKNDAT
jgi:hypothetical protein